LATYFKQTNGNAKGDTSTAKGPLVSRNGPRVARQSFQDACQLKLALLGGHQESGCANRLLGYGLAGTRGGPSGSTQPQHVLNLLWLILLPPPENVRFAALCIAEFVYLSLRCYDTVDMMRVCVELGTYHGTKGDKANKGVRWDKAQADDKSISQCLEILLVETGIYHKQEDWGNLGRAGKCILDSGVLWQEFSGKVGVGDVLVMRGEGVARKTEGAYP
jgi:hypothetical protein